MDSWSGGEGRSLVGMGRPRWREEGGPPPEAERERYGYKIKTWTHDFPEEPRRIKKALGKRRSGMGIDERKMYHRKREKKLRKHFGNLWRVGSRTFAFFRIFVANPPLNLCAYAYFPYFSTATLFSLFFPTAKTGKEKK